MREDNSWTQAARQYTGLYQWALQTLGR